MKKNIKLLTALFGFMVLSDASASLHWNGLNKEDQWINVNDSLEAIGSSEDEYLENQEGNNAPTEQNEIAKDPNQETIEMPRQTFAELQETLNKLQLENVRLKSELNQAQQDNGIENTMSFYFKNGIPCHYEFNCKNNDLQGSFENHLSKLENRLSDVSSKFGLKIDEQYQNEECLRDAVMGIIKKGQQFFENNREKFPKMSIHSLNTEINGNFLEVQVIYMFSSEDIESINPHECSSKDNIVDVCEDKEIYNREDFLTYISEIKQKIGYNDMQSPNNDIYNFLTKANLLKHHPDFHKMQIILTMKYHKCNNFEQGPLMYSIAFAKIDKIPVANNAPRLQKKSRTIKEEEEKDCSII